MPLFFRRPLRPAVLLFLISLTLLSLAACQPKGPGRDLDARYMQDYEEEMTEPYTPRDDGIPLSPAELKAFRSQGRIDAGLAQKEAEIVELHFKYFVHEHRRTFERYLERSARFLPYIRKVFEERGIPGELAYLCMVESGGNPNAVSRVGAAGLWQFMPSTGRKYGLSQNTWLDERRDPFKATAAAADYLLQLYSMFSNWHLAVAAYNAGEGKIGKVLSSTGARDFFELCRLDATLEEKQRLREETRQYVPRLIAVAKIMRNLKALGFPEPRPEDAWNLDTLQVPPGTNLAGLARTMGLTWDEFSGMNPAFRRTASPPATTTLAYVEPEKKEAAVLWLASAEARIYAGWQEYTVRRKDTLAAIGKRYKVSVASLRQANNISSLPRPGAVILIPGKGARVEPVYDALPAARSAASASAGKYVVRQGDTLYSLAQIWGTDVDSIRLANRMGSRDTRLSLGQRLSIPGNSRLVPLSRRGEAPPAKETRVVSAPPRSRYLVRSGDTPFAIARANKVSLEDLYAANNLKPGSAIRVGQSLRIPEKEESKPAAGRDSSPRSDPRPDAAKTSPGVFVTVARGDTLYSLSLKHRTSVEAIREANGLGRSNALRPGQKLKIP
ncbi:MAG: LysM peptidoglycan-binding domain-containing protein [Desulfovibrio sp.]|nr:LysM peptidoglycan-binding domain-containing protein [Desulfovibrio sp.]